MSSHPRLKKALHRPTGVYLVASNKTELLQRAEKYSPALADKEGKVLDYIYFEVRGPEIDCYFLDEDKKGAFKH